MTRSIPRLKRQRKLLVAQAAHSADAPTFEWGTDWYFAEDSDDAGTASGHYFHQDLYVAQRVFERQPQRHVDVGSRLDGFVAHLASFRSVEVWDIRPLESDAHGILFRQADFMDSVPSDLQSDSVSCLHALEHFGLGRYGDPIDFDGWRKGLRNLVSITSPGGFLYVSVPSGAHQRIEFNAQRVFNVPFFRDALLELHLEIIELAFVTDQGRFVLNVDPFGPDAQQSFDAEYGLAIWTTRRRRAQEA